MSETAISSQSPSGNKSPDKSAAPAKKKPNDFQFGRLIGEGSYSNVFLAREVSTGKEYAIKVLEKQHIIREKKSKYVMREKEVFSRLNHPFFIGLYFTFQDADRLYFGLTYAQNGELLDYIKKLGCFDENCTRFYSAEIVSALEHLHGLNIIHRDLKPENILLSSTMHIQITDFGSAKILMENDNSENSENQRKNSFVGTAQYVSPEVLKSKPAHFSQDLWSLGCIIYQLLSGELPFYGNHEYDIFKKILAQEYKFPEGFYEDAKDLVSKLLMLEPTDRLGCLEKGGYAVLKEHPFFTGVQWDSLPDQDPPKLLPFLPGKSGHDEDLWSKYTPGLNEQQLSILIANDLHVEDQPKPCVTPEPNSKIPPQGKSLEKKPMELWLSDEEKARRRILQRDNEFHQFVEGNLIVKQGLLDKRKGLFARRRMFLLTEGPHLYYVDPQNMVLKGEIPWSKTLQPEAKNFRIFFVHTPNRTYYLEDPEGNALKWCSKIEEVYKFYYGNRT